MGQLYLPTDDSPEGDGGNVEATTEKHNTLLINFQPLFTNINELKNENEKQIIFILKIE